MNLYLQAAMVATTIVLFVFSLVVNELVFQHSEFIRGANWIYLPAGIRLVCTLLFGEAGAIGLLLASWLVSYFYFFPDNLLRAFAGGVIASLAPYAVYRFAQASLGLRSSLANLTPRKLLLCAALYSTASPLLHWIWFVSHDGGNHLDELGVMFVGDLIGTLIVLYVAKLLIALIERRVHRPFRLR